MSLRLRSTALALVAGLAIWSGFIATAHAADYALVMGIGNYKRPSANLPGIDKDVQAARRIAQSIGVPAANIRTLSDGDVSSDGIRRAMQDMESSIGRGDRVFIYYSGHGGQESASGSGARCTEGMVAYELSLFRDVELEATLARLATKAGQLVMFNDSCFSGGAASKATPVPGSVAKYLDLKSVGDNAGYTCGDAVNMKTVSRNLVGTAAAKGNNMVYIAAAADDEVAFATPNGSAATLAWESCLKSSSTDTNGSGSLTAGELMRCAQARIKEMGFRQTITIEGNKELPLSFAAAAGTPPGPIAQADAVRRSAATLEDIRQAASPTIQVELQLSRPELKINQDPLDFSIRTNRAGYLYVLHVGPDGKTFDLLFPNQIDQNNQVQPGTIRLPRPSWRVMAAGPVGEAYVLAIVSETQRDFTRPLANKQGPFNSAEMGAMAQEKLRVEATGVGASGGSGTFGASVVARVREHN